MERWRLGETGRSSKAGPPCGHRSGGRLGAEKRGQRGSDDPEHHSGSAAAFLQELDARERIAATAGRGLSRRPRGCACRRNAIAPAPRPSIEITDAELALANANIGQGQALCDYHVAHAQLRLAMGGPAAVNGGRSLTIAERTDRDTGRNQFSKRRICEPMKADTYKFDFTSGLDGRHSRPDAAGKRLRAEERRPMAHGRDRAPVT